QFPHDTAGRLIHPCFLVHVLVQHNGARAAIYRSSQALILYILAALATAAAPQPTDAIFEVAIGGGAYRQHRTIGAELQRRAPALVFKFSLVVAQIAA